MTSTSSYTHAELARLAVPDAQARDPEIQHLVDAVGPFSCPLAQLAGLVETAGEDDFLRGWLSGVLAVRQQIALVLPSTAVGLI